jgi:hypothetical protein
MEETAVENVNRPAPKAPRWITTEAGQRAWEQHDTWRHRASGAMSVQDRSELLAEAEEINELSAAAA